MEFFDLVTKVITFRSFSNLWYWIGLAILWSMLSYRVLGIPYHMVQRSRRGDDVSARDLRLLAEINSRRILDVAQMSGPVLAAGAGFVVSTLAVLGWGYGVELAQATILLILPVILVAGLSVVTAHGLRDAAFEAIEPRLRRHRLIVLAMALVSIFATAFWGMYVNLTFSPIH